MPKEWKCPDCEADNYVCDCENNSEENLCPWCGPVPNHPGVKLHLCIKHQNEVDEYWENCEEPICDKQIGDQK